MKKVHVAPDGKSLSAAQKTSNKAVFAKLDDYFDFDRLVEDPIAPNRKAFSAAQHKRFSKAFRELIRLLSYPRSGAYLKQAALTWGKERNRGSQSTVKLHTELVAEDFENDITFYWGKASSGKWKLVDVAFDGASLVKDYRAQFSRLIKKNGVDGLIKKLEAKLNQTRKAQGAS